MAMAVAAVVVLKPALVQLLSVLYGLQLSSLLETLMSKMGSVI